LSLQNALPTEEKDQYSDDMLQAVEKSLCNSGMVKLVKENIGRLGDSIHTVQGIHHMPMPKFYFLIERGR
jgi:hypothetical protein